MTRSIQRSNPPSLYDSEPNSYSQVSVVEPGRLAFFSGQVAWTPDSTTAPESLTRQAEIVVQNLRACLEAVDATQEDIVMVRVYVVDLSPERLAEVFPALEAFFEDLRPSLTAIGVQALAAPDLQLEVEMVVRVPS